MPCSRSCSGTSTCRDDGGCVPTRLWMTVFLAAAPLWLVSAAVPGGAVLVSIGLAVWVGAFLVARARLPGAREISATRNLPRRAARGDELTVTVRLAVERAGRGSWLVDLRDELPPGFEVTEEATPGMTRAGVTELSYRLRARERGPHTWKTLVVRLRAPGGLADRVVRLSAEAELPVYPRLRQLRSHDLEMALDPAAGRAPQSSVAGSGGTEFESLRSYVRGDHVRHIDWKATARREELIVRNHQIERGQHVALILDCGRIMKTEISDSPRVEYALEATLLLSHLARERSDSVSLLAFSNQIEANLPSMKGPEATGRILDAALRIRARDVESDYWHLFGHVLGDLRKRSFIVVFTDVSDPDSSRGLVENVVRAARQHVVLCVAFDDPAWRRTVEDPTEAPERRAAAALALSQRRTALEFIRARGARALSVQPEELGLDLIRTYAELRNREFA